MNEEVSVASPESNPQIDARLGSTLPRVVILGAGPAGLAAAHRLSKEQQVRVHVLEKRDEVGGNAGSFQLEGVWCDHGSHRLHAVVEPRVMDEVRSLLGAALLWRPRHGRILLQKRWIHFPLKPVDLALRLRKSFAFSLMFDTVRKVFPRAEPTEVNFATMLEHGLGPAMSEAFYFPYMKKLFGLRPEDLAIRLAERRISGSSVFKILKKVLRQLLGLGPKQGSGFYYPKQGFGMISEALSRGARECGAEIQLNAGVTAIEREGQQVNGIRYTISGTEHRLSADAVWSTLPLTGAVRMMQPAAPPEVIAAADKVCFRGMILIYLVLETDQFTEYDAHYFPELSVPISRMSEPKNYSAATEPVGKTVLCAELPSDPGDEFWGLSDAKLGELYCQWLGEMGLPVEVSVSKVMTRRLRYAYPVYDSDYSRHFKVVDDWLAGLSGFLSYGRQGLFAHDNTHHAMTMAYAAVDCLKPDGGFDDVRWAKCRLDFESHVVED